ncbi:MAG: GTPase HflX [Candidatus Bathyarchaeota archaeon]
MTVQRLIRGEASHLEEIKNLAESAGYLVVGSVEQLRNVDSSYQIGKGKAKEIAGLVEKLNVQKIIFDNALKPIQAYNIAKITRVEAIDRFQLILEIFAKRVSTRESQLQVQLAFLRYQLPRARESIKLAKMGEQPGFQGLGRYEIDVYLEAIKRQIAHIRKELKSVHKKRNLQRTQRMTYGLASISLAGYTYAGKTTLFNALTGESKSVDKGLFTTLSTTTRAVNFIDYKILLTDTVGFVDHLPLILIEAFHSTLEDTVFSDLIILVVDFHESVHEICRKLNCCIDTLNEIGAFGIPIVTVLNKIDVLSDKEIGEKLTYLGELIQNPVPISAKYATNIDVLKQKVIFCLNSQIQASFSLPLNEDSIAFASGIYSQVNVLSTNYDSKEIKVALKATPWLVDKIRGQVDKLGGRLLKTE